MTKKLYEKDSYCIGFCAEIVNVFHVESGIAVELDETVFFPEGGGQKADRGRLTGCPVIDVQIKDGHIIHSLGKIENKEQELFQIGGRILGELDWNFRFSNMQQHTGEHILSGLINNRFGFDNVGFHLGTDTVTLDFNGLLTEEQLTEMEYLANEAVIKNIEIIADYPSKDALEALSYRSKKEIFGEIRIVTIPGYDCCACCAPHVKRTGEVGMIKIVSAEKYKGGMRIGILCGFRALERFNQLKEQADKASVLLSVQPNELSKHVERLSIEYLEAKALAAKYQAELLQKKAEEIMEGTEFICLFEPGIAGPALRNYANLAVKRVSGAAAVFSCRKDQEYLYCIAGNSADVRPLGRIINECFQGKGGGTKEMVQGSLFGCQDKIKEVVEREYNHTEDI